MTYNIKQAGYLCSCIICKQEKSHKGIHSHYLIEHTSYGKKHKKLVRKNIMQAKQIFLKNTKQKEKIKQEEYNINPKLCKYCNTIIPYFARLVNKFCNSSCAAKFNNKNKKSNLRISKLELFLQKQLTLSFPNLTFIFNSRKIIKLELDIYIKELKLGIEINGICHYFPIYGQNKLNTIQKNDKLKIEQCSANDIKLIIVDISKDTKDKNFILHLENIKNIILNSMAAPASSAPAMPK